MANTSMKIIAAAIHTVLFLCVVAQDNLMQTNIAIACYDSILFDDGCDADDLFSGTVIKNKGGEYYTGKYKKGLKDGNHMFEDKNYGIRKIENWKSGMKHGYFEGKIGNEIVSSENYTEGRLSGDYYKKYYPKDTVIIKKYIDGVLHGDSAYIFISKGDTLELYSYNMGMINSIYRYETKIGLTVNDKDFISYKELNSKNDFEINLTKMSFNPINLNVDTTIIDTLKVVSFILSAGINRAIDVYIQNTGSNLFSEEMLKKLRIGTIDNDAIWIEDVVARKITGDSFNFGSFKIKITE